MSDPAVMAETMSEAIQTMVGDVLGLDEVVADPDWEGYALLVNASDTEGRLWAYRYRDGHPPVPTPPLRDTSPVWRLREATRGADGQAFEAFVLRIHRGLGQVATTFHHRDDADQWRVSDDSLGRIVEALRPTAAHFG